MHLSTFSTIVFLFFCQVNTADKFDEKPENVSAVLEGTNKYLPVFAPADFRCDHYSLKDFRFYPGYKFIHYMPHPQPRYPGKKVGCVARASDGKTFPFYPIMRGHDPLMAFYIGTFYEGIDFMRADAQNSLSSGDTKLSRMKFYCSDMRLIAQSFLEYWESFHSDSETCRKIMVLVKDCNIYRQIRESYNSKLYEKLCLSEDGCYNVMEYYAEDLPYCVKYTAIAHFKNASVGSWHHSIINYCHLREMVPEVTEAKYEQSILKGKTKSDLTKMCFYLRHRLLPEEGKETEIPDDYDTFDEPDDTTDATENGISNIAAFWTITFVLASNIRRFQTKFI